MNIDNLFKALEISVPNLVTIKISTDGTLPTFTIGSDEFAEIDLKYNSIYWHRAITLEEFGVVELVKSIIQEHLDISI